MIVMVDNPNKTRTYRAGKAFTSDGTYINIYDLFVEIHEALLTSGIIIDDTIPLETLEQDNTAPPFIVFVNQIANGTDTDTATIAVYDAYSVDVVDITGFVVGYTAVIADPLTGRFYFGKIMSIVGNTITLDTPFDYDYPVGSLCDCRRLNMNIDGSTTTEKFYIRGEGTREIPAVFDISRIIITCTTATPCDLSTFGDLAALTNGLVMRRVNGETTNIFNVKSNQDLANLAFDFQIYDKTRPNEGQDGFTCRLTFNGQSKMGVAIRIGPGEDIEFLIQDDLSALTNLKIIVEGHIALI